MDVKGIKISEFVFQVEVGMRMGAHEETIILDVAPTGLHRIILGLPWFEAHDPTVRWPTGHIRSSSHYCNINCLPQSHDIFAKQAHSTCNQSPEALRTPNPRTQSPWSLTSSNLRHRFNMNSHRRRSCQTHENPEKPHTTCPGLAVPRKT
jgi:hypothetical protein